MLSVSQLCKSYGVEPVFRDVHFDLNPGERLGIVGPNGCGKTTLLRIIVGDERADRGSVRFTPSTVKIGYLPQGLVPDVAETIGSFLGRMVGDVNKLSARLEAVADLLAVEPGRKDLQDEYDLLLNELQVAAENEGRVPATLAALGLEGKPADTPVQVLSGGQKTRLGLAGVLLSAPQLMLLDEPTNHLDINMLDWLENWLLDYTGAVLFVSHDRSFLDRVATGILEIDPLTRKLKAYVGNYSTYLAQKQAERERQWQVYTDQQEEIARLRRSSAHLRGLSTFRKGGKADTGDKFALGFFANRSLGTMGRAKQIETRIEHLLTDERVDKPGRTWQMKADFTPTSPSGRDVLVLEDLSIGYENTVLLSNLSLTLRFGRRAVLIGPNGSGKTTLLRTVVGQMPALAGRVRLGSGVQVGYMAQEQEVVDPRLDALTTICRVGAFAETEARSFLSLFLFKGDDVFTKAGNMSYGERSRLMLACLVASGCNFLLLDEPINHLDIPSRASFEQALTSFHGTILAVVHDRYFIESFANEIWEVSGQGIRSIRV